MVQLAPLRLSRKRWPSPLSMIESLATPHDVDTYLGLVNPMLTVRKMRAVVTDVQHLTADTVTLALRPTRQGRAS